MKTSRNIITILLLTLFNVTSYAQSEYNLAGEYIIGEQNTIVKIVEQDNVYSGKVIASESPKAKIGNLMVKELKQTKGKWKGKVYAPRRKKWIDAEFTPKENSLEIKVKVGFMSKTMEWKRK